jgi:hypothetical protein
MAEVGEGLQRLELIGAVLGLAIIPISISYRAWVFKLRHDINTEMVPVLYERFLVVKAGLDFALCTTIFVGAC